MARKNVNLADHVKRVTAPATPQDRGACSVNIPKNLHKLLRLAAIARAEAAGSGRPSVSAVVTDYLERHRKDLEAEARKVLI